MQIIIRATDHQFTVLANKLINGKNRINRYESTNEAIPTGDLYIDASFEEEGPCFSSIQNRIVLVNGVSTLSEMLPKNFVRFNGWDGFLSQPSLEIAGNNEAVKKAVELLEAASLPTVVSADELGMIGPRVVSMIINEAYFALAENISTKEEINTAMKLGTNYPYGPFEWCELIGFQKVLTLLQSLAKTNERYSLAPAFLNH
jgi:3-hydroxybutyryl-CoA dehydrogenase